MKFSFSLKNKILILTITGVVLISICSIITINIFKNLIYKSHEEGFYSISHTISTAIQDQFFERYGDVLAFTLRFQNVNQSRQENEKYLNTFVAMYGIYDLILVTDLQGNLMGVNSLDPTGKKIDSEKLFNVNFSNESWFKGVLEKKYLEEKSKGFENVYFEDAHFNPLLEKVYGKKVFSTIFSTFIYNYKGDPVGILSTHANFKWVENIFVREFESSQGRAGHSKIEFTLLNKKNDVIIDYDPAYQNNNNQIVHDESILNKLNLLEKGVKAVELLQEKDLGYTESMHARKKELQLVFFEKVKGKKIVDSLGWRQLVRVEKGEVFADIYKIIYSVFVVFSVVITLVFVFSILFSRYLSNQLNEIAVKLYQGGKDLLSTATKTSQIGQELSAATTQQASSLQETVAAVTEISSMLSKTAEMSSHSQITAEQSSASVEEGKKAVNDMLSAIQNIKMSTKDIFTQVEDGNKKISEIVQVINDIENKTKVINEIVFQTKLLSFNASVEAARAGEHGKGFAVVAEEVGNLAQMSGVASREISVLLEQSTTKVKNIVAEISSKVSSLVSNASHKIQEGEAIGKTCSSNFEKIYENTSQITSNINEIKSSTKEQAKGVQEISQAMHELDSVTQQNSYIAQNSSQAANKLLNETQNIENLANELIYIVSGLKNSNQSKNQNDNKSDPSKFDLKFNKEKIHNKEKSVKNEHHSTEVKTPSANDPRFEDL